MFINCNSWIIFLSKNRTVVITPIAITIPGDAYPIFAKLINTFNEPPYILCVKQITAATIVINPAPKNASIIELKEAL